MKDRFFSLLGTSGLIISLAAFVPTPIANASGIPACGGTACVFVGAGLELRCDTTQPAGTCTGQSCSCTSGARPGTGTCNCVQG